MKIRVKRSSWTCRLRLAYPQRPQIIEVMTCGDDMTAGGEEKLSNSIKEKKESAMRRRLRTICDFTFYYDNISISEKMKSSQSHIHTVAAIQLVGEPKISFFNIPLSWISQTVCFQYFTFIHLRFSVGNIINQFFVSDRRINGEHIGLFVIFFFSISRSI